MSCCELLNEKIRGRTFDLSLTMVTATNPESAAWYAALTVAERADRWRAHFADDNRSAIDVLDDREAQIAAWRMEQWVTQAPFSHEPSLLARRFADLAVPSEALPCLLGASSDRLAGWKSETQCGESAWLTDLMEYLHAETALPRPDCSTAATAESEDLSGSALTAPIAFLVHGARRRLLAAIRSLAGTHDRLPFVPNDLATLASQTLLEKLTTSFSRVIALEIQVASIRGVLEGDTPERRARSFADQFRDPHATAAFLSEYPAAARLLAAQATQWYDATIEMLQRLCADCKLLDEQFGGGEGLGSLVELRSGVGDSHRDGRSVMLLLFSSGIRIVYKPRSLAVDVAYGGLLEWVNSQGFPVPLLRLNVLDRETYGWTEHITASTCSSVDALARYYERLGAHLALQYLLDGSDLHRENVIAAGEHPYFVDLESLFHPALAAAQVESIHQRGSASPDDLLRASVLKTGLLPSRIWTNNEGQSVDVSGIGGAGGQVMPGTVLQLHGGESDSIWFSRERYRLDSAENVPIHGAEIPQDVRLEAIERGFSAVYRLLLSNASLLSPQGLLEGFVDVPVRVILRPTQTYGLILRESLHPDFLRDAVDRDRFFDKLWIAVRTRPELIPVIQAERLALQRGEVPVFYTTPQSRDLICDTWGTLPGFFDSSALDRVSERIEALGSADEVRQRWLIRASLATAAPDPFAVTDVVRDSQSKRRRSAQVYELSPVPPTQRTVPHRLGHDVSSALLSAASEIGDRLASRALIGRREVSWFSITGKGAHDTAAGLAGYDLHGGLPGILLFFHLLAEAEGEARFERLFEGSVTLLDRLVGDGTGEPEIGAFSGLGGVLYSLGSLGPQRHTPREVAIASTAIQRISTLVSRTQSWNVFGGLAGAIAGLVAWAEVTRNEEALTIAARCGARIRDLAQHDQLGIYWGDPSAQSLSSLAFGTSGVAWALARLAMLSQDPMTIKLADDAFLSLASRIERDPNVSLTVEGTIASVYRGLAGIPIAAAAISRVHTSNDEVSEVAMRLLRTTATGVWARTPSSSGTKTDRSDSVSSHALCNGTLGALDLTLHIGSVIPDLEGALPPEARERIAAGVLRGANQTGWRCGTPLATEVPGLMNGLAGIGAGLLRLRSPASVPSIVAMEFQRNQIPYPVTLHGEAVSG